MENHPQASPAYNCWRKFRSFASPAYQLCFRSADPSGTLRGPCATPANVEEPGAPPLPESRQTRASIVRRVVAQTSPLRFEHVLPGEIGRTSPSSDPNRKEDHSPSRSIAERQRIQGADMSWRLAVYTARYGAYSILYTVYSILYTVYSMSDLLRQHKKREAAQRWHGNRPCSRSRGTPRGRDRRHRTSSSPRRHS